MLKGKDKSNDVVSEDKMKSMHLLVASDVANFIKQLKDEDSLAMISDMIGNSKTLKVGTFKELCDAFDLRAKHLSNISAKALYSKLNKTFNNINDRISGKYKQYHTYSDKGLKTDWVREVNSKQGLINKAEFCLYGEYLREIQQIDLDEFCDSGKYSVDRIDNSEGYTYENIRWAKAEDQIMNRDNSINIVVHNGSKTFNTIGLHQLSNIFGIAYATLYRNVQNSKDKNLDEVLKGIHFTLDK